MAAELSASELRGVFDDLIRFETILWNSVDARLRRDCGLPLGNFNLMLIIASTPACRVYDIATALAISVGGTSQAVDRVEAAGYCRRRPNPDDRRSSILELTPSGQNLLTTAGRVFDEELATFLRAPLTAPALRHLATGLAAARAAANHRAAVDQP